MATVQSPEEIVRARGPQQPEPSAYERAVYFVEDNRTLLLAIVGGILLAILLVVGFMWFRGNQAEEASVALAEPVRLYEAGQYEAALQDEGDRQGLLSVADDYGSTQPGNLAHYYAADALFRLGRYDEALEHFEAYDGDDTFVEAGALAGQAAIYEVREDYARAADLFRRAAEAYPNQAISPGYYLSALRNYARVGNDDDAREVFETLQERYPDVVEVQEAQFYLGMLEAGGE